MKTMTAPVQGMNFATCATSIEKHLGALPAISEVNASYATQTVTITYDEHRLDEETLRALVQDCGFACGQPMTAAHLLHAAAEAERAGVPVSLARATADDVAVVAAPTREPAGAAADAAPMPAQEHAVPEHAAHAAMDMDMDMDMDMERGRSAERGHGSQGGMAHDMSDPAMAAAMEADMRQRFL